MNRSVFALSTIVLLASAAVAPAGGQAGVVGGTVVRDSLGHGLPEAQVSLPALNRAARTNYLGEFRIDGVPAGRHLITIRRVGFAPFNDSVTVSAGQTLDAEFVMTEQPVTLDSQKVVAAAAPTQPNLREFEDRRKAGLGRFIATEEMRAIDNHSFGNYLVTKIPGMRLVRVGTETFISAGRGTCDKPAFSCGSAKTCYVSVYVDGVALYVSGSSTASPPDWAQLRSEDYAALEYYADGASAPAQYNATGSACGVLLLWRRYR